LLDLYIKLNETSLQSAYIPLAQTKNVYNNNNNILLKVNPFQSPSTQKKKWRGKPNLWYHVGEIASDEYLEKRAIAKKRCECMSLAQVDISIAYTMKSTNLWPTENRGRSTSWADVKLAWGNPEERIERKQALNLS
jgi:hypothetical protein